MAARPAPDINIGLSIEPPSFQVGENIDITLTVVSDGPAPVTVYTYSTILNLDLAQQRRNFFCLDLDTNTFIDLEVTKGYKRNGFVSFTLGGKDDRDFTTLKPDQPITFRGRFQLSKRTVWGSADNVSILVPGHRYRFGVQHGEVIRGWWRGKKEDIMAPRGQRQPCPVPDGVPIALDNIEPFEFEVKTD